MSDKIRQWSDLPKDILIILLSKLYYIDRIRFTAVCKSWRLPIYDIPIPLDKLPWKLIFHWHPDCLSFFTTTLYDPIYKKYYTARSPLKPEHYPYYIYGSFPHASKYGWVLFCRNQGDRYLGLDMSLLFLYSPFEQQFIMLPYLDMTVACCTFTSTPTSPDCTVYTVDTIGSCVQMGMLLLKDRTWKRFIFHNPYHIDNPYGTDGIMDVTYLNGTLYCIFSRGLLAGFDVALQEWSFLTTKDDWPLEVSRISRSPVRLFEIDGQLFRLRGDNKKTKLEFWRFEFLERTWIKEANMHDRAAFVSDCEHQPSILIKTDEAVANSFSDTVYEISKNMACCFSTGKIKFLEVYQGDWETMNPHLIWILPPNSSTM